MPDDTPEDNFGTEKPVQSTAWTRSAPTLPALAWWKRSGETDEEKRRRAKLALLTRPNGHVH